MKPKVLVTVDGGIAQVFALPAEVDVVMVDYDNEPGAVIPAEFQGMPDYFAALAEAEEAAE